MFGLGMWEVAIIGAIAVLLFGKRLPEVARSVGASYTEFRKGLANIQSDLNVVTDTVSDSYSSADASTQSPAASYDDGDDREEATAPMFEPPSAEPTEEADVA